MAYPSLLKYSYVILHLKVLIFISKLHFIEYRQIIQLYTSLVKVMYNWLFASDAVSVITTVDRNAR